MSKYSVKQPALVMLILVCFGFFSWSLSQYIEKVVVENKLEVNIENTKPNLDTPIIQEEFNLNHTSITDSVNKNTMSDNLTTEFENSEVNKTYPDRLPTAKKQPNSDVQKAERPSKNLNNPRIPKFERGDWETQQGSYKI